MGVEKSEPNRVTDTSWGEGTTTEEPATEDGQQVDTNHRPMLSVVLPTRNEEDGIAECIRQIKQAIETLDVTAEIIVSDSSSDRTPAIAQDLGATVVTPSETGYGNAYKEAFEHARGEYIAIGDADTTYDFTELPKLLRPAVLDEADLVLGSRFAGEIKPGAMPRLHQYVGNPLLTAFLNRFYKAGVTDAHSGFRVIRRDALKQLNLQSEGMEFASEMVMDAAEKDLEITEVPITYYERVGEATLDSLYDGWRHVKFMLINAPTYVFTLPALVCTLVSITIIVPSLLSVHTAGVSFGMHTMLVGSLLLIVGYQIGSLGVYSAVAADPIKSPDGQIIEWLMDEFRLEHGAIAGLVVCGLGVVTASYMTFEWLVGHIRTPFIVPSLLAYTAIILGIQTIFNSICLSILVNGGNS
ncbi:glycosyltransferase family 2 protein [Halorussus salinisoli]|uniref:glycosyltransferase family 2 protein n=1 Tax=Halorussus salinisoli TaxID=2558242 RepID=UPI0010C18F2C|nr:glycosyltransferase family 2 protein [Halorussus salinisoli]